MQVIDTPAGAGINWIRQAWKLFTAQPGGWISLMACWSILSMAMFFLPLVGQLIAVVIQPALFAGFVIAARDQEDGIPVTVAQLFAGFRANGRQLISLGAAIVMLRVVLRLAVGWFDLPSSIPFDSNGLPDPRAYFAQLNPTLWLVFAASIVVSLLIDAIFWFTVPLLALNPMTVGHAVRWSFYAFVANFASMAVFGVVMTVIFFVATLPLLLGMLIAMPLFTLCHYTSYRQVFADD